MNISIITWASTKMLQKGWHRQVFIFPVADASDGDHD
jgi:sensor c-di-GMP phosphodiesterase-like protein